MSRTRAADLSLFFPMPGIKRGPAVITAGPLKAVWADFAVRSLLELFQFETLRVSKHTACRFTVKRFSLLRGRLLRRGEGRPYPGYAAEYIPVRRQYRDAMCPR